MVAVYAFNVFTLVKMSLPATVKKESKVSPVRNLADGAKYIWGYQAILALIVMAVIMNAMGAGQSVLMPVFAKQIFDVGAGGFGLLLSAGAFGGLIGALIVVLMGSHPHRAKVTLVSTTVMGVSLALFSISPSFGLALFLAGFTGMNSALFLTLGNALLLEFSASNMRGRVMGVRGLCLGIHLPASLAIGFLADGLGARSAGVMLGVTGVASMLVVAALMPGVLKLGVKKEPSEQAVETGELAPAGSRSLD
jgi:predicted MFS family arabinose efflux permease